MAITDCLVLKIEERDADTLEIDATLYILYDKEKHHFVVRGKRFSDKIDSCTFSFNCEFAYELIDFISFVVCMQNKWTYVLYNYDNLPYDSNEITYDFMEHHDSKEYELAGYNCQSYNKKALAERLRMLRNVFNYYK